MYLYIRHEKLYTTLLGDVNREGHYIQQRLNVVMHSHSFLAPIDLVYAEASNKFTQISLPLTIDKRKNDKLAR